MFSQKKTAQQPRYALYQNCCAVVVELGGIEPPSESTYSEPSPGAVGYGAVTRNSRFRGKPTGRPDSVASLCMVRSKLCARTDAANRRRSPGPQRSRVRRACLKRRPVRDCCSQLFLKGSRFYGCSGHPPAYSALAPPSKPLQPRGRTTLFMNASARDNPHRRYPR